MNAVENQLQVLLKCFVVTNALANHLFHCFVFAMIGDGWVDTGLPLIVPDRGDTGDHHERAVDHVDNVKQTERNRHDTLALKVIDMINRHRAQCLVIQRMQCPHAPLQRVENQVV